MPTMPYDPTLYDYDKVKQQSAEASLRKHAHLYRIAHLQWTDTRHQLSGNGALKSSADGRFHKLQQASYCSNNVLTAISEVLYHNYRTILNHMTKGELGLRLWSSLSQERALTLFQVKAIPNLVYLDSEEVRIGRTGFGGTMNV